MKIRYREAGGVTGLSRGVDIDTAALSQAEARRITELVEQAGLSGVREKGPTGARDLIGYQIVIEREEGRTEIQFDDATAPESADALLAYLQGRARPIPLE